jgi:hypothetical protein
MANARSVPRSLVRKPPNVGSPGELPSPPSAIVKAVPAGELNRTAAPSAMSATRLSSATRIFPADRFGFLSGNKYTPSGANTEAAVAPSSVAIHQPRNVLLVGNLELAAFVLTVPTTTGGYYSRLIPSPPRRSAHTTNSSICPSRTRESMRGRSAGAVFSR